MGKRDYNYQIKLFEKIKLFHDSDTVCYEMDINF